MGLLDELLGRFLPHTSNPDDYADVQSMFGRATVYDSELEGEPLRVLDIEGTWQSASYMDERWADLAFPYHRTFDLAFNAPITIRRALMLGGGALSYPKHVVVQTDSQVEVVEIDPVITELAEEWFFLDRLTSEQRARLHVTHAEALAYIEQAAGEGASFDLVVNDLFAAEKQAIAFMGARGAELLNRVLTPEGIYVANVVSAIKGRKARPLRMVKEALGTVFSQIEVISFGEDEPCIPDNTVVFATNGHYSLGEVLSSS